MINHPPYDAVNWVDGMKISKKHFDAHTNFILDGLREVRAAFCNVFNYGLLPIETQKREQSLFSILGSLTGDLEVIIKHCSAITPLGFQIELTDFRMSLKALMPQVGEELQQHSFAYYVVISVNPFNKVPHGVLDLEETPPRYPFTKSSYHLELISVESFDPIGMREGGNFIMLGKVYMQGGTLEVDANFIPPCTSVISHPLLLQFHDTMTGTIALLQKYAVKIIQKNKNEKQNTKIGDGVKALCQVLIDEIGGAYYQFRNIIPYVSPVYMVEVFSKWAIHLHLIIQTLAPEDVEEMLNYIGEWSDIAPHTFLNQVSTVAEINYEHVNCAAHLHDIQVLLTSLEKIFLKLSELDYIGQRKENIIVNEVEIAPPSKGNRGWSVLD
ncbi:hypothetical protein [Myroides sp. WP-1]|uniref:hypothetical protein n=1 Tax=Myroides sp. WP-1 TaxID=2759944 RepID=UPI0015FD9E2E|nr:hypothetical protein [Myroides sp. WP-1]MBB1139383.1 hypothetical protein [Myroides sp. WP-1]